METRECSFSVTPYSYPRKNLLSLLSTREASLDYQKKQPSSAEKDCKMFFREPLGEVFFGRVHLKTFAVFFVSSYGNNAYAPDVTGTPSGGACPPLEGASTSFGTKLKLQKTRVIRIQLVGCP